MSLLTRNKGAMLLLMFNIFIAFVGIGLVVPIMPAFMNELGLKGGALGFLFAAFSVTQFLFSPMAGRLSDRFGRKKMIIIGLFIFALSELLFGFANSLVLLVVGAIAGGIGAAFITPSIMAYVDITSKEERAKGMGFLSAAISSGFIIGPGIGGFIAEFGIRVPFFSAAVAAAVGGLISMFILPESVSKEQQLKARSGSPLFDKENSMVRQLIKSYKAPYFIGLVIVFVLAFGLANFETVFSLYVDHKHGFTPKDIAIIITFGTILGALVQVTIFGALLNKFGEQKIILTCLAFAGVFIYLTIFVNSYWMIMAVTFIIFLATDILRPTISTFLSKLAGEDQGFVAGMNSSYTSLGNIVGPLVAGTLFDIGIDLPYIFAAIVLLICLGVTVIWSKKYKKAPIEKNTHL